jgi:hypothetical protein
MYACVALSSPPSTHFDCNSVLELRKYYWIHEEKMEIFGDIFGGFMVILFILGFFLMALWFILPFVIFAMKGRVESAHLLLENIDKRLSAIEKELGINDNSPK